MSEFGRLKALLRRSARDGTARPGRVEYGTGSTGVALAEAREIGAGEWEFYLRRK